MGTQSTVLLSAAFQSVVESFKNGVAGQE